MYVILGYSLTKNSLITGCNKIASDKLLLLSNFITCTRVILVFRFIHISSFNPIPYKNLMRITKKFVVIKFW